MTSQELTKMIANKDYPESVNPFYRDWINGLYADGRVQQAVKTLQSLIDNPKKPIRTLL